MGVAAAAIGAAALGAGMQGYGMASQPDSPRSPEHQLRRNLRTYYNELTGTIYPRYETYSRRMTRDQGHLVRQAQAKAIQNALAAAPYARQLDEGMISGDIERLGRFGPRVMEAGRGYNPRVSSLLDIMGGQAESELGLGAHLDPSMRRELAQSVRAGQSARGLGYSPSDVYEEAFTLGKEGQALREGRRRFAGDVVGMNQGYYGRPMDLLPLVGTRTNPLSLVGLGMGNVRNAPLLTDSSAQQPFPGSSAGSDAAMATGAGLIGLSGNLLGSYYGSQGANPYYGRGPGDVPYNYGGDPSALTRRRYGGPYA